MVQLSKEAYLKARDYLLHHAREIDKAMFMYEFEGGSSTEVLSALKPYQNADKGFGNGLEPDLRCKESSALATTIALQYLSRITTDDKLELVKEIFEYLENTYIEQNKGWEIIPAAANEAPRAIWWNYNGFQEHWGNPNAEILGYFYEYRELSDKQLTDSLQARSFDYLLHSSGLSEMHELFCYVRLYERLPEPLQSEIAPTLQTFIKNCVVENPSDRTGYCAVPLQIVDSPSSRFYDHYKEVIPHDLDELIKLQSDDGTWLPNWEWGRYEEEWVRAKEDWKGFITLQNLRKLSAFGRIEK